MKTPKHATKAEDLQTKAADTKAGFLEQAMAKTEKAERYVDAGERLITELDKYDSPDELFRNAKDSVLREIIAASGYSDKACKYFRDEELRAAAKQVVEKTYKKYPKTWKSRIAARYLLTRGDSLGGEMRNWIGARAGEILSQKICDALAKKGVEVEIHKDAESGKIKVVSWQGRRLMFDVKSPLVGEAYQAQGGNGNGNGKNGNGKKRGKNIDVVLLSTDKENCTQDEKALLATPDRYLACGELKGGIDKAGADEHYKTANSAIQRIKRAVPKVKLFFIGRAIEASMAGEIHRDLSDGTLDNAANLTKEEQVDAVVDWLISL